MSSSWIVRKHFIEDGRFLKRQIYICLVPFTLFYLLICLLSLVLGIVYIANTINFMGVKEVGFTMGNHLITVPRALNASMNEIFDAFDLGVASGRAFEVQLSDISTEMTEMNQYLTEASILLADRHEDVRAMIATVEQIDVLLQNMSQYSFPATDFGRAQNFDFATSADYETMLENTASFTAAFTGGAQIASQLSSHISLHRTAVDSYQQDLDSRFNPARSGFHTMVNSLASFLDKYVTDFLTNYDLFSVLTGLSLAIILVGYLFISPFVCATNYYAVFKMNHKMLRSTICCSCFSGGFFLLVFACALFGYSVVFDACEEVNLFHEKAGTIAEAVAFREGFAQISIPVDLSNMIENLMHCDSSMSYSEAAGISDVSKWTIDTTMDTYSKNLSVGLNLLNTSLVAYTREQLTAYATSFSTPTTPVTTLSSSLSSELSTYYTNFMKTTYNYNVSDVDTAKSQINTITEPNLGLTFTYANILELNTSIAPFSTNLTSTQLETLDTWRPILVSERAAMLSNAALQPLTEFYASIRNLLSQLSTHAAEVNDFLRSYANANVSATRSTSWISRYEEVVAGTQVLPSTLSTKTYYAVGNSSSLGCAPLGTFFSRSEKVMCSDFSLTTLLTSILSLLLGLAYVGLFFVLLCTHYRVEYLSELPYKMRTVRPFTKRNKFSMTGFGGVDAKEKHVELEEEM